jgi:hypothetical protein
MSPIRKAVIAIAMVGSTLTGGAIGAALFAGGSANAATSTPSTTPAAAAAAPTGTFHPNEDATHEAGESAAREAQENAGQVPTVP